MHVGAALVADEQSFEAVQPGERALDDPTEASEPGAVWLVATRDDCLDSAPAQLDEVVLVVVGAVGEDTVGTLPRVSRHPCHRRDSVEQRDQLQNVVAVAGA